MVFKRVGDVNVKGYRMINLDSLQENMNTVMKHVITCEKAKRFVIDNKPLVEIISELRTLGLASVLVVRCAACNTEISFETSPKIKTGNSTKYDVNVRAVWGSIVTGNGASHLKEVMATMDAPSLSQLLFSAIEKDIGSWWQNLSQDEMLAAGCHLKSLPLKPEKA